MTLPDRVKIGPYIYNVYLSPDRIAASDGNGWSVGQIDYKQLFITVVEAAPRYMFATFIHECLHAIDDVAETGLSEKQISRLANGLAAFLIDNGYASEESDGQ